MGGGSGQSSSSSSKGSSTPVNQVNYQSISSATVNTVNYEPLSQDDEDEIKSVSEASPQASTLNSFKLQVGAHKLDLEQANQNLQQIKGRRAKQIVATVAAGLVTGGVLATIDATSVGVLSSFGLGLGSAITIGVLGPASIFIIIIGAAVYLYNGKKLKQLETKINGIITGIQNLLNEAPSYIEQEVKKQVKEANKDMIRRLEALEKRNE